MSHGVEGIGHICVTLANGQIIYFMMKRVLGNILVKRQIMYLLANTSPKSLNLALSNFEDV